MLFSIFLNSFSKRPREKKKKKKKGEKEKFIANICQHRPLGPVTVPPDVDWQYENRPGEWKSYDPGDLGDVESRYMHFLQGGGAIHEVTLGGAATYSP